MCKDVIDMSKQFGIIMDGTQDIQGKEQESVWRYVTEDLDVKEDFLGLYLVESTTGILICNMLCDVMIRLQLPDEQLRAQTYDGSSNMAGEYRGCQAEIKKVQPLAHYVHCGAHMTNLVISKAVAESIFIRDALNSVQELGKLCNSSGKFKNMYLNLNSEDVETPSPTRLKPICPTRWLTRAAAVKSVLDNYQPVLESLEKAGRIRHTTAGWQRID
jgi:hypothetical protein